MNKEEYSELLKNPLWKKRRAYILERDGFRCRKCGCDINLQVHHKYYIEGRKPWDVPDECLITLCADCHKKEHDGRDIKSFIRYEVKKKNKTIIVSSKKRKKKKNPPKPKFKSSKKIQKKRDHLKKINEDLYNKQNRSIRYNFAV